MSLILAGIDEAGYGPTLGPLVVAMAVFRVRGWSKDASPDLWSLLSRGVTREPGRAGKTDARGRIAVADSKKLKLSNAVRTTHPLIHLERGVLSFLAQLGEGPATDADLLAAMGARWPAHECYAGTGEVTRLPVAESAPALRVGANMIASAMEDAGVELVGVRAVVVGEEEFNAAVREHGSKAEVTARAFGTLLGHALDAGRGAARVGVACDRLGGRATYADLLRREAPGAAVETIEETDARSRYVIDRDGVRAGVAFVVEGEAAHLPVALASMAAKYVRELAMARFNAWWGRVHAEIKGGALRPTAGYAEDARRWLDDVRGVMSADDRRRLVRIA